MHNSSLFDEKTFYRQFIEDLRNCRKEAIIESPFITNKRMEMLFPVLKTLVRLGVKVTVITRDPREHVEPYKLQSEYEIRRFEQIGIQPLLCTGNHHRKLAILDRKVLWEGSLNILSQTYSREIMRRIDSEEITMQMFQFLKLGTVL